MRVLTTAAAILAMMSVSAHALEVHSGAGVPVKIDLGFGFIVNEKSGLQRQWTIVNDPRLPVSIDPSGFKGLSTSHVDRGFQHEAVFDLKINAPVAAVKIITVPVDVWNETGRPLALSQIEDFTKSTGRLTGTWRAFDENEASEILSTLSFVGATRLADGTVLRADYAAIMEEAKKLSEAVKPEDLDPKPSREGSE